MLHHFSRHPLQGSMMERALLHPFGKQVWTRPSLNVTSLGEFTLSSSDGSTWRTSRILPMTSRTRPQTSQTKVALRSNNIQYNEGKIDKLMKKLHSE